MLTKEQKLSLLRRIKLMMICEKENKFNLNALSETFKQVVVGNKQAIAFEKHTDKNLNISDVSRSLNDILFDLFLDGYELGIVSKDMKESDYIDARKEAIKKAIQEINTLK